MTFDGHRTNDFNIYMYKTMDYGKSWKVIKRGIPEAGGVLNLIREHPEECESAFCRRGVWFVRFF